MRRNRELSAGDKAETTALQQHLTNKIASGGKKQPFSALDQWLSLSSVAHLWRDRIDGVSFVLNGRHLQCYELEGGTECQT